MANLQLLTAADFDRYNVANANQAIVQAGSLYDSLLYPTAGTQILSFFQNGVGQGLTSAPGATVNTPKTYHDTNMDLGGQLPSGTRFLAQGLEFMIQAGTSAVANTFVPAQGSVYAAAIAAAVAMQAADVSVIARTGLIELDVLSRNQVREVGLYTFPPASDFSVEGALAVGAAAGEAGALTATTKGNFYTFDTPIALNEGMNFTLKVSWPGLVATPSGFNARIIARLRGTWLRATQ